MKRLIASTGIILLICVCVSALSEQNIPAVTNVADYTEETSGGAVRYTLKAWEGKVAVFKEGGGAPYMVTDTPVSSLPKSDRKRFENGITVEGELPLKKALEDYCS